MKAHEIFDNMSPGLAARIFSWLQNQQKEMYKATVQGLANQRKLRPIFIERRPPAERHTWLKGALSRGVSDALAGHVVQAWLLGANQQMLNDFLDALEIQHGEDGTVDELPQSPTREKLGTAIDGLLAKYPVEEVAVYLHAFQSMDSSVSWVPLGELLEEKPELHLGSPAVSA